MWEHSRPARVHSSLVGISFLASSLLDVCNIVFGVLILVFVLDPTADAPLAPFRAIGHPRAASTIFAAFLTDTNSNRVPELQRYLRDSPRPIRHLIHQLHSTQQYRLPLSISAAGLSTSHAQ
jgi:hypothetical protein